MWVFRALLISLIIAITFISVANAQNFERILSIIEKADTTSSHVRIELKESKDLYVGVIVSYSEQDVTIEISAGIITIEFENINEIRVIYPGNKRAFWFSNHARNRLFIYPSAIANKAGTGYYQNIYIVLSKVSYTPVKGLSVNVIVNFTPFIVFDSRLFAVGAKYSFSPIKDFYLAVSATRFSEIFDDDGAVTTFSTLGTFTYRKTDFSFGLGFGADVSEPLSLFGLQSRVTQRLALVTENFIVPGEDSPILSLGPRFLGKKMSADLGFFIIQEAPDELIPFVSFTTSF